jgi:hypothetical protein
VRTLRLLGFAGFAGFWGCTSLLGDFSIGGVVATRDGGDAASSDVAVGDSTTSDGPVDGALPMLKCAFTRFQNPRTLPNPPAGGADAGPGSLSARLVQRVFVQHAGRDVVRVVMQGYEPMSPPFAPVVYTFNPNDSQNASVTLNLDHPQDVMRIPGGFGIVGNDTLYPTALYVQPVPDSFNGVNGLPPPRKLSTSTLFPQDFQAAAVPIGDQSTGFDYFYAASYNAGPAGTPNQVLAIARARNTETGPTIVAQNPDRNAIPTPEALFPANGRVYFIRNANDNASSSIYAFPDDANTTTLPPERSLSPAGSPNTWFFAGIGPSKTPGKANVGFFEVDKSGATLGSLRVGQIDFPKLDTFVGSDLPRAITFQSLDEAPVNDGAIHWFGDDLVVAGRGAGNNGVNFLWVDAFGNIRARAVAAERLLVNRPIYRMDIAIDPSTPTPRLQQFHFVWIERSGPESSPTTRDVIHYDQLTCSG